MNDMLDQAIEYSKLGLSVVPCRKDKRPFVTWEDWQTNRPSIEQITNWWRKFKSANAGIICGEVSGVDVLDIDSQEAYQNMNENFLPENLETPILRTPRGGYQIWFKHRKGLKSRANYLPKIDVRTDKGFAVVPKSYCEYDKDGVHVKGSHEWVIGCDPWKVNVAPWPDFLFSTLQQCLKEPNHYNSIGGVIGGGQQGVNETVNICQHMFEDGRRDDDLFHTANCLVKGGMKPDYIYQVLERLIISWGENPDKKWIDAKIKSALGRVSTKEKNLAHDVREWVVNMDGVFCQQDVIICQQLSTRQEKQNLHMVLKRLCVEGLIEKYGNRHGYYRRIEDECKPVDWINAETNYIDFWLPLGLDRMAGVQPGNIMMIAGSKDAGKTAFLLNIAKENRHRMKVHYFNSEMGESEFKLRMSKFDDVSVETLSRDIKMYPRHDAFHAAIKPGEGSLNIIDFLEVTNDFWRVSEAIKQIHQKLDGALCVIGLQKNPHVDLGRGGSFSLEKARLYISLDYGKAKIISCKNFKEDSPVGNPRSYSCNYKLVNGCRIIKQEPGWTSEAKERK